jgi:hypothetical protein
MRKEMIAIKPHHFVDIITLFGDGQRTFQPHPYGHAVHTVSQRIMNNHDILLEIELGADDICKPCIHNIGGSCDDTIDISFRPTAPSSKRDWNLLIDRRWCDRIKVKQGNKLSARELVQRIRDYMGDITDIYCEIPADRTTERMQKLLKGIQFFLEPENNFV